MRSRTVKMGASLSEEGLLAILSSLLSVCVHESALETMEIFQVNIKYHEALDIVSSFDDYCLSILAFP